MTIKKITAKIPLPENDIDYTKSHSNIDYDKMIPPVIEQNQLRMEQLDNMDIPDEFEESDIAILEQDDGSIIIEDGPNALAKAVDPDFYDNLRITLSEELLDELSCDLIEYYEEDREARHRRDEQQDEGLRRMGLDPSVSGGGANFEGSSKVVHPMISQNCVDFAGRSVKELFPANGPVKAEIIGEANSKKINEADRKVNFLNKILTDHLPYRHVLQQMLSQLPIGGTQFIKIWHDDYLKRPTCEFLPVDNVYIPFQCNDFYSAERVTIKCDISQVEYDRRIKQNLYYDIDYEKDDVESSIVLEKKLGNGTSAEQYQTKSAETRNKIEGKEYQETESDCFTILEIYTYLNLPNDHLTEGEYAPYIVTMRLEDEEIVSIYRNWSINDPKKHKLDYLVKFDFIPWAGAYGLSLAQLIGSLSVAATGALRALLDSAHVNNIPTALGLKGMKMTGQSPDISIGNITFLDGPSGIEDDIRKCMMPLPFNPPCPVLFQLLEWLTNAASTVVKMPDTLLDGMGDRTPANTTLAMIEQGSTTQSAIMANLHFAQKKVFEIIGRLICDFFDPEGYPDYLIEDYKVNAELFEHTRDVVPVSDPNIFTEVQRYAQLEAIMKLASSAQPGTFNFIEIYRRALQLIKIPNPEMLLNIPNQTTKSNASAENMAMFLGQPIEVYPDQDDLAHLKVHFDFTADPIFGSNPIFNTNMVGMIDHVKHHLINYYAKSCQQMMKLEHGMQNMDIRHDNNISFDKLLAEVSPTVMQHVELQLKPIIEGGSKVLQMLQQMQQQQSQQNQNPDQVKLAIEQAKLQAIQSSSQQQQQQLQSKQQEAQNNQQLETQKLQQNLQVEQLKNDIEQKRLLNEWEIAKMQVDSDNEKSINDVHIEKLRLIKDHLDNATKLHIEYEKSQVDLKMASLHKGHELGMDAAKHQDGLNHDMNKHKMNLEHQNQLNIIKK